MTRMFDRLRRRTFSEKSLPFLFLGLTLLAYGLLLPWTGFYWDDWPFAWIARFLGPQEFIPAFSHVRPFLGPIFLATTSLLPETPLAWQAFALLVRFALALSAWWAFKNIWPEHPLQSLTAALLFLVYPGYSQHWVAFTHINQELIPFFFYLVSFGLTGKALHDHKRFILFTVSAMIFQIAGVFPTEYFLALEPLRFLFIWSMLAGPTDRFKSRFARTLKHWLPYLLVWIGYAIWLYSYYTSGAYKNYGLSAPGNLQAAGWAAPLQILKAGVEAIYKAGLYAWVQILPLAAKTISAPSTWGTLGLILTVIGLLAFYLSRLTFPVAQTGSRAWGQQAMLVGLIGILLGRIPSWVVGLPLTLQSSFDRFTVSMMIGACLLAAGLIEWLFARSRYRILVIAMLVALGVGQQFFNANIFRRDWARQQEIYWQFAWRIPALKPNTLLLTNYVGIDYETDFSFTAALNWMYAPDFKPPELPYAMMYSQERLGGKLPALGPGLTVSLPYRTVAFHGSTSQAIVFYVSSTSCLRVLDPVYANKELYARYPDALKQAIDLSDPGLIQANAATPALPEAVFGAEPAHTWCYYYERAELARQQGNWDKVAKLGEQVQALGYKPQDPTEWLPFIEAYTYTGNLQEAERLSKLAWDSNMVPRKALCSFWKRIARDREDQQHIQAFFEKLQSEFSCGG
jgi:hypothetical protein